MSAPCEFNGISIGDNLTKAQLMAKLGISKFKDRRMDGPPNINNEDEGKFGYGRASEIAEWKFGPYCAGDVCKIPYGVEFSSKIPASVEVVFAKTDVTDIVVSFDASNWDLAVGKIVKKYGANWEFKSEPNIAVMGESGKVAKTVTRVTGFSRTGGVNTKTHDRCELTAQNYPSIYTNNVPFYAYQSSFVISRRPADYGENCHCEKK